MTDSRLRSHERSARAAGLNPDHDAQVIRERLRVAPRCGECGGAGRVPDHQRTALDRVRDEMRDQADREGHPIEADPSARWEAEQDSESGDVLIRARWNSGGQRFGLQRVVSEYELAREKRRPSTQKPCSACCGTGSPYKARVELAAFSGSEGAREALGACVTCKGRGPGEPNYEDPGYVASCFSCGSLTAWPRRKPTGLDALLSGLSRWSSQPYYAPLRAAVAAARESLNAQTCECGGSGVRNGARCPECRGTGTVPDINGHHGYFRPHLEAIEAAEAWLRSPTEATRAAWRKASEANTPDDHPLEWSWQRPGECERQIGHAVHFAGSEAPIRAAIQQALTSWALEAP